jgi:integrase
VSSIEKLPNGKRRVRYRSPDGLSRSQTFDRLEDARAFQKSIDGAIVKGDFVDPAQSRTLFDSWGQLWWETTVSLMPSTRYGYRSHLDCHVLPYFSGWKIGAIDFATVELFIADRLRAGLGPKMVRQSVSVLALILDLAVQSKALTSNPARGHKIKVRRRRVGEGDVLDMAGVQRLVAHVGDRWKPAVWLLAFAGLRPAELCGLRVSDVDFGRRTVSVRTTLMPVHRFDDEPTRLVEGPPKSEAGNRTIPIPGWLCDDLAEMLAKRGSRDRHEWLFLSYAGNPVNRDIFRSKVLRPALRAAGLPETVRTYDLRHSHASLLIDLGANPLAVAQRMGHSDANVTLSVYGHLFEGAQALLTEELEALRQTTANAPENASVINLDKRSRKFAAGHE